MAGFWDSFIANQNYYFLSIGHEAYRDGIKSDEIAQKIETHEAALCANIVVA